MDLTEEPALPTLEDYSIAVALQNQRVAEMLRQLPEVAIISTTAVEC